MCGIYGMTGIPTKQTTGIIKRLGELNESRGRDSTGLAFIGLDTSVIYKDACKAEDFFKEQKAIELLCKYRKNEFLTILGHTRAATHGDITSENAHPFKEDNIFFTHNGIISNFYNLLGQYNVNYEVDSQIIGYLLANKKTFFEAFSELQGYFTVPYVDTTDLTTLKVAVSNNVFSWAVRGNQLYYSSDIEHLKLALAKQKGFSFYEGDTNVQYSFYPFNGSIAVSKDKISSKPYFQSYKHDSYQSEWEKWIGRSGKSETISTVKQITSGLETLEEMQEDKYDQWLAREAEEQAERELAREALRSSLDNSNYPKTIWQEDELVIDIKNKKGKKAKKKVKAYKTKLLPSVIQTATGTDFRKLLKKKNRERIKENNYKKTIFKARRHIN